MRRATCDSQFHVDVAASVFGGVRVDRTTKSQALVETKRIRELGVGLKEDRASALLADPVNSGRAEHLANAAPLVRRRDSHLGELVAPMRVTNHGNRADDACPVEREEDHAALGDDRLLGVIEHLEIRRLHFEQALDPVEVEPAKICRVLAPERNHADVAHARLPFHSRASSPRNTESWMSPSTSQRSRKSPSCWKPSRPRMRSELAFRGSTAASRRRRLIGPKA